MNSIRLICTENGSNKFWEGKIENTDFVVFYGAIGAKPQTSTKYFFNVAEAHRHMEEMVKSKIKKGYRIDGSVPAKTKRDLEEEFTQLCNTVQASIKAKHKEITELHNKIYTIKNEMIDISDNSGIPFNISGIYDGKFEDGTYLPCSFFDQFDNLDKDFVIKTASLNCYELSEDYAGWNSSSC